MYIGNIKAPHVVSEPAIMYFGTPTVLVSTTNEDGSFNIAPMSSAWWLGWRCMLGFAAISKTPQNMIRTAECVLNLPSVNEAGAVNRLARFTGSDPVPPSKISMGYAHERNKFEIAGLTPIASQTVAAPRALECPVQLEAVVCAKHEMMQDDDAMRDFLWAFEVRIKKVHIHPDLLMNGNANRIDPDKWKPLIMSFQKFYGLAPEQIRVSKLAEIPESSYRTPDVDRSREADAGR
jgi:flavin reductase (DIM6/NTAB) family NADH-FMN oxidoreductase RutF